MSPSAPGEAGWIGGIACALGFLGCHLTDWTWHTSLPVSLEVAAHQLHWPLVQFLTFGVISGRPVARRIRARRIADTVCAGMPWSVCV